MEQPGYEDDICYFCHGKEAGFQRRKEDEPKGEFHDCCQKCLIKDDADVKPKD